MAGVLEDMVERLGRTMARRRRRPLATRIDAALVRAHQVYENLNYDMGTNGERRLLERLAAAAPATVIFDVGANLGEWSRLTAPLFPKAAIHAFEISPDTFRELASNLKGVPRTLPHEVGLSDRAAELTVHYVPGGSGISTTVDGAIESFFGFQTQTFTGRVVRGDDFCSEHGITGIDLLKLDVEGAEYDVLKGFEGMLSRGTIRAVQFEYGYVSIITKRLLRDFHELLEGFGMAVGKIYPNGVEFREYRVQHEDFLGPNFLAVKRSDERLIRALS